MTPEEFREHYYYATELKKPAKDTGIKMHQNSEKMIHRKENKSLKIASAKYLNSILL